VQVWSQSNHLSRSRSDLRKNVYRQTDRQTDGQIDNGRRAIVLAHGTAPTASEQTFDQVLTDQQGLFELTLLVLLVSLVNL